MASLTSKNPRLKNEYDALCKVPINSLSRWAPTEGQTVPYVRSYTVTYTNPYPYYDTSAFCLGSRVKVGNEITIRFDLGANYPNECPAATIVKGEIPYLTNVFSNGKFCFGDFYKSTYWLWEWFNVVGHILAGDPDEHYTNPGSAANRDAANFFLRNKAKFPYGRIDFPRAKGF